MRDGNLLDFLDISPNSFIFEYRMGSDVSFQNEYKLLGINVIEDTSLILENVNPAAILVARSEERLRNIRTQLKAIKAQPQLGNTYLILTLSGTEKSFLSLLNSLRAVSICLLIGGVGHRNPLLFVVDQQELKVSNLLPDWPNTVTGKGNYRSVTQWLRNIILNVLRIFGTKFIVTDC